MRQDIGKGLGKCAYFPTLLPWCTINTPCCAFRDSTFYDTQLELLRCKQLPQFHQRKLCTLWGPCPNRTQFLLVRHSLKTFAANPEGLSAPIFSPWTHAYHKKKQPSHLTRHDGCFKPLYSIDCTFHPFSKLSQYVPYLIIYPINFPVSSKFLNLLLSLLRLRLLRASSLSLIIKVKIWFSLQLPDI